MPMLKKRQACKKNGFLLKGGRFFLISKWLDRLLGIFIDGLHNDIFKLDNELVYYIHLIKNKYTYKNNNTTKNTYTNRL